jgi:hypothetical protein
MADDPLPAPTAPAIAALPTPSLDRPATRSVTCEYCGCSLDTEGLVLHRGDAARRFARLADDLDTVTQDRDRLARDLDAVKAELSDLRRQSASHFRIPL